jgi:hypothetical protein
MNRLIPAMLLLPFAIMGTPILLLWWLPPFVSISRKGVLVMQGQSAHWYLAHDIQSISLLLQVPRHPLIRVRTAERTSTYGIAAKVNLAELETFIREMLPEAKCVRVAA